MNEDDKPQSIMFFPNGTAAVCNRHGQMPKYQDGDHSKTIELLKADGIDWKTLPEILGSPQMSAVASPGGFDDDDETGDYQPFGDGILDDEDDDEVSDIGTVHGPENCPRTCSVCSGKHHWIDKCHDPDEPMDDWQDDEINGSRADVRRMDLHHPLPQGIKREAAHWVCKHCPAWAEYNAGAG